MLLSGALEKFRFCNGAIERIEVGEPGEDGIPKIDYKKYVVGEGSANVMTSLFPSSAGELSTEGGRPDNHLFIKDCESTPELIAAIISCVHNLLGHQIYDKLAKLGIDLNSVKAESLQTIIFLLRNAQYMIEHEEHEEQNEVQKDRILPKFFFERVVMCYSIKNFNTTEELNRLYTEVGANFNGRE